MKRANVTSLLNLVAKLREQPEAAIEDGSIYIKGHPGPHDGTGHSYALGSLRQRVRNLANELELELRTVVPTFDPLAAKASRRRGARR